MFTKSREFNLVMSNIKDRKSLYFGIAAALSSAAIAAVVPYIYGRLVDIALKPNSQAKMILGFILLWLILSIFSDLLSRYGNRKSYEISSGVTSGLLVDLFQHLIDLPISFHKERRIGKIMRSIDRGLDELDRFIESTIFSFLPAVFSFFVALIILLFVEWRLSLVLVASSISYVAITFFYTKTIIQKQKIMHRGWEKAYGELWDSVLNVATVKSSTTEKFERKKNVKNFNLATKIYRDWRAVWDKMRIRQRLIFSLTFIAVMGVGIMMLRAGILTPGKLIMFVGYTSLLTSPLSQLADQYRVARTAIVSFKRATKYYDISPEKDLAGASDIGEISGEVRFDNVNFGYKKEQGVLKGISFAVGPGETAALVGESGVGKSTLADLIGRYYLPTQGKIFIDGIDTRKITLRSLREKVAIVPQEVLFFNDTIENNIRYGRINATDEEVAAAAKAANAHEFIENFPKKYKQLVGERGIKLSAGQKQRVAIARAILRDSKILILDEATSALDSASEKLVQEALKKLIKGRTTFIIAHRLSTIQHADKIIVLEKGKVAEIGTHAELMRNSKGIYRNFWELQTAIEKV